MGPNTVIALDIALAALEITSRVQQMLLLAQSENRDLTRDEIQDLKTTSDEWEQKILAH